MNKLYIVLSLAISASISVQASQPQRTQWVFAGVAGVSSAHAGFGFYTKQLSPEPVSVKDSRDQQKTTSPLTKEMEIQRALDKLNDLAK